VAKVDDDDHLPPFDTTPVAPKRKGKVVEFKEDLEEICLFSAKIS
jgi:hypothetical protein